MFPRYPRLFNGHLHLQLPHRNAHFHPTSSPFIHRPPLILIDRHFQVRLKSKKPNRRNPTPPPSKNQTSPPPPPPQNTQSPKTQPPTRPAEESVPPLRQQSSPVVTEQSPVREFFNDIRDWRYSTYLFFTVVSTTSFVVFCFWAREAYRASEAKKAIEKDEAGDGEKGRFVTGAIEDIRYVTSGQEWLLDNFTVTPTNMREGRYWTLVTSLFSHQLPIHLALNIMAAQFLMTPLCRLCGTIPIAISFFVGGIGANYVVVSWMNKRAGGSFDKKYPGQFFGYLGMSGAVLSVVGFGAAALPGWKVRLWNVIPLKVPHLVIGIWLFSALQYWTQTGWDKIQSGVSLSNLRWLTIG
jgi:membrane associated rhomboid family serine protease